MRGSVWLMSLVLTAPLIVAEEAAQGPRSVEAIVDATTPRTPISPLIFGANHDIPGWGGATIRRWGGNSSDTYNWENNFNNSGRDSENTNSRWQARAVPPERMKEPAAGISVFHEESLRRGVPTIVTLPFVGYVAADEGGPVAAAEAPPSKRWKRVEIDKHGPLADRPDLNDDVVYLDEMVTYLVKKFGPASSATGIKYWAIGNEPGLWSGTHPLVWPKRPTCREFVARSIAAARMVKRVDPSAQVLGPAAWHQLELVAFSDAPDWPEIQKEGGYRWFADYYLSEFRRASEADGKRLLDVFTIQYYAESDMPVTGGYNGIAQSPRTLWEQGYYEPSWVGETQRQWLPVFPLIRSAIDRCYPGTRLGLTEFDRQMADHVAGGLATADTLGILADQGVFLATIWPLLDDAKAKEKAIYEAAAYQLYRDADGQGMKFGDILLAAASDDNSALAVHASADAEGRLHLVLINKNFSTQLVARVKLKSPTRHWRSARAFGFDRDLHHVTEVKSVPAITENRVAYRLPPASAVHLVLSEEALARPVESWPTSDGKTN